jgi:hypothetical protein
MTVELDQLLSLRGTNSGHVIRARALGRKFAREISGNEIDSTIVVGFVTGFLYQVFQYEVRAEGLFDLLKAGLIWQPEDGQRRGLRRAIQLLFERDWVIEDDRIVMTGREQANVGSVAQRFAFKTCGNLAGVCPHAGASRPKRSRRGTRM